MDTKFKPGTSGNPAGKPPGTTKEIRKIRAALTEIINDNLGKIKEDLAGMKPYQRLTFIEKLLRYVIPGPPAENILDGLSDQDLDRLINHLKKQLN